VTVADTVGAGDSFMAALIAGLDQLELGPLAAAAT
jgi:sugar/nucleoside kinase (ribokinase family)